MEAQSPYNDVLIRESIKGTVIKFFNEKGYGFIKADDKSIKDDVYVYFNQIRSNEGKSRKLSQNQEVTFDLYASKKGLIAKNVICGEINHEHLFDANGNK